MDGGTEITVAAALDFLPLFVKAGAIVPIGPVKQHTGELSEEPVTLRVYPGASGKFTWYDDDGRSFEYENGKYMRVACEWNDASRTLTLTRDNKGKLGTGRRLRAGLAGAAQTHDLTLKGDTTQIQL